MEAAQRGNLVPVYRRIFADHLTPVLAYRCLVKEDDREAPSFLFESVENGKSVNMVCTDSALLPSFQRDVHEETQAINLTGSNFWREISSFCCGFSAELTYARSCMLMQNFGFLTGSIQHGGSSAIHGDHWEGGPHHDIEPRERYSRREGVRGSFERAHSNCSKLGASESRWPP